jgi:aspartyl-tRNA(Asn)/glutamyl-tRNA(Gln) amidotransferase subunit A
MDATAADEPVPPYAAALDRGVAGLTLGVPDEYFVPGLAPAVEAAVREAIDVLTGLGARTRRISLPHTDLGVAAYYVLAPAEASSNLARYDGVRFGLRAADAKDLASMSARTRAEGFGPEVKRRVMLGTYVLSAGYYEAYYGRAQRVRTLIRRDFDRAFAEVDAIVTPTTPTPAFPLGAKTGDPLAMYLNDVFTIPAPIAGVPAISVPCGVSPEGLPIGLQVIGRPFDEATLFRVAGAYEGATDWHTRRPGPDRSRP